MGLREKLGDGGYTRPKPSLDPLAEIIAKIIDPVSFEKVRQHQGKSTLWASEDAEWRCNRARDKAAHIISIMRPGQ